MMVVYFFLLSVLLICEGKINVSSCPLSIKLIEKSLLEANIPGLAAIVINATDILYEQGFGYNSPPTFDQRRPIDPHKSIFVLASISKTIIALAAMQLVETNQLDLGKDINQYLSTPMKILHPFYPTIPITIRHILSHRSGIGPNFDEEIKHYLPKDDFTKTNLSDIIFSYVNNTANWLRHPPGSVVHYSNIGASLAALVIERIARMSFEEYVHTRILQPLGINDKDAGYRLSAFEDRRNDLIEHYLFNSSWLEQAQNWLPQLNITQVDNHSNWLYIPPYSVSDYPSALLRMSAHSLAIYFQSFLKNFPSILSNGASTEEMIRVPVEENADVQFGLIWNWRIFKGKRFVGHRGAMPGITNMMMANEQRNLGVILLSNGDVTKTDQSSITVYETLTNLMSSLFDCFEPTF